VTWTLADGRVSTGIEGFDNLIERGFPRLYSKLGLTFVEKVNWRLTDYVGEARGKTIGRSEPVE